MELVGQVEEDAVGDVGVGGDTGVRRAVSLPGLPFLTELTFFFGGFFGFVQGFLEFSGFCGQTTFFHQLMQFLFRGFGQLFPLFTWGGLCSICTRFQLLVSKTLSDHE